MVGAYSHREMTLPSDKLVAISALSHAFGSMLEQKHSERPRQYAAGLWQFDLPPQLLWRRWQLGTGIPDRGPDVYRAPSWSWAPVNCSITFADGNPLFKVLNFHTHLKDPQLPYGEVTGGVVVLKGRIKQALGIRGLSRLRDPQLPGLEHVELGELMLDEYGPSFPKESNTEVPVWCLEAAVFNYGVPFMLGLVLLPAEQPYGSSHSGHCQGVDRPNERPCPLTFPTQDCFSRVGTFEMLINYRTKLNIPLWKDRMSLLFNSTEDHRLFQRRPLRYLDFLRSHIIRILSNSINLALPHSIYNCTCHIYVIAVFWCPKPTYIVEMQL
jgi:hypothetical protein